MMFGFWFLILLFVAGLWWFGRASGWKKRCECVDAPQGKAGNGQSGRLVRENDPTDGSSLYRPQD